MLGGAVSLDRTPIDTVAVACAFADNFAYYGGAVAVAVSGTFAAAASTSVCKSTSELGRRGQTSEFSSSVKSKSIRLIFGRIDCSR
jgi:hypothetical protein